MALKNLLKAVQSVKNETVFEDEFLKAYEESLISLQDSRPVPMDRYRPSSLADGCSRMIYYHRLGLGDVGEKKNATLIDICDNGTDRHSRIQKTIKNIKGLEWLDVGEVVKEANKRGINTTFLGWDEEETEGKCNSKDLNCNFLADGIFRYKGNDIILEIKTIHQIAFNRLTEPLEKHIRQVACYSMALGIDSVLFVYEDRNFLKKKLFLYRVKDEDKEFILNKIDNIEKALKEGKIPPKELDKCLYCDRKEKCKQDGE